MATKTQDVTRLPQWAQQRITKLEADVEYWKQKAGVGDVSGTNTYVEGHGEDIPLPRDGKIRFKSTELDVTVWVNDDTVNVNAREVLAVVPSAANSLRLRKGSY